MPREFQKMIRIRGTNLDGAKRVAYALTRIEGLGVRLADVVVYQTGVDKDARLGFLSARERSPELRRFWRPLRKRYAQLAAKPAKGHAHW